MTAFKRALLERLPKYYQIVRAQVERCSEETISSAQIADLLGVDDTQVRKDLASIQVRGYPRVGYRTEDVLRTIRSVLGFDAGYKGVIVGAGRLGGALATYPGFEEYGLQIVGIFDSAAEKVGTSVGPFEVYSLDQMDGFVKKEGVSLAILTVPAEAAADLADRLSGVGIRAIWNFSPARFAVPPHVSVRHEQISLGLAELSYHLSH